MMQTSNKCCTFSNWRFWRLQKMFRLCDKQWQLVKPCVPFLIRYNWIFWPHNVSYFFSHECLAVLQVVPLHDGRAVKFGQRMCTPADKIIKDRKINTYTHTFNHKHRQQYFWLALSGRDCWFLCGRYRGRKQQPPWQRHLDLSSTFSASLSIGRETNSVLICALLSIHLCMSAV